MTDGNNANNSFSKPEGFAKNSGNNTPGKKIYSPSPHRPDSTFQQQNQSFLSPSLSPHSPNGQTQQNRPSSLNRSARNLKDPHQQKQNQSDDQAEGYTDRTDELKTINLIESLEPEAKKMLNALVQSVLTTQKENESEKIMIIAKKRQLIQQEQLLEQKKLAY